MKATYTVVALVLLAFMGPARADRDYLIRDVQTGDTLALLAAEYYGDRNQAVFIMDANKIKHGRDLTVGEKLRIPLSRDVTTRVGDTFEELARTHLGDARRGPYLAEFNRMSATETPSAGRVIVIPFHAVHTAAAEESLASIAAARFGNSKNAALLRGYNFLGRDSIHAGESIIIPIIDLKVRSAALPPPDPESAARKQKRERIAKSATVALTRAHVAWRRLGYNDVKRALIDIDLDFLDTDQAAKIAMRLGAAYIALGDIDSAEATFRRVMERRPSTAMSPYYYSPRVREIWLKAGGLVDAK